MLVETPPGPYAFSQVSTQDHGLEEGGSSLHQHNLKNGGGLVPGTSASVRYQYTHNSPPFPGPIKVSTPFTLQTHARTHTRTHTQAHAHTGTRTNTDDKLIS